MALISLREYAIRNGKEPDTAKHKAQRGGFKTAVKIGRDWLIDEDEPYVDRRIKTGNLIGVHQKRLARQREAAEEEESL